MSGPEIFMLALVVVVAVGTAVRLPPLHPAQLWSLPWAGALGLFALRLLPYRRLSVLTCALIAGATVGFVLGTLVGERWARRWVKPGGPGEPAQAPLALAALGALALTGGLLAAFLWQSSRRFGIHDALVSSVAVRQAIGHGGFSVTIKFVYAALAAAPLCGACAARGGTARRNVAWALGAVGAVGSLYFSTGRGTLVYGAVIVLVAYALARPPLPRTRTFLLGVAAVAVLAVGANVFGGQIIGKTYANNPQLQAIPSVFSRHHEISELALPYEYASAPIPAFDVQMKISNRLGTSHGCAIFTEECSVLHHLGVRLKPIPRLRQFTGGPLVWNTYTGLDLPLYDFGFIGVIPAMAIVGLLIGGLWGAARLRRRHPLVLYPILASAAIAAYSQFNFTAPHILGGMVIASVLLAVSRRLGGRMAAHRKSAVEPGESTGDRMELGATPIAR